MGPEHTPTREVPIPQPAAAAIERGVDAAADGVVDEVRFTRARRLPMEREAENKHDEARGCCKRDRPRRGGAPLGERRVEWLQNGEHAGWIFQGPHRRERDFATREVD